MSVAELINTLRSLVGNRSTSLRNITLWYGNKKVYAREIRVDENGINVDLCELTSMYKWRK
jgi:hypothetical protein